MIATEHQAAKRGSRFAVHTAPELFRRARHVARRIDIIPTLMEDLDSHRPGPRRVLSWEAWFTVMLLSVMHSGGAVHMTKAQQVVDGLTSDQRRQLGLEDADLNYGQIESGLEVLVQAMEERVNTETGEVYAPRLRLTAGDIGNSIIQATLPSELPFYGECAIDSTDYESDAARRSRASLNAVDELADDESPEKTVDTPVAVTDGRVSRTSVRRTRGGRIVTFPQRRADGRLQHSLDPDATDGYRSGKQMNHKDIFNGYDNHIACATSGDSGHALPALALGMELTSAGSNKAAAGLALIDRVSTYLKTRGDVLTSVCVDRGYSMAAHENWAQHLIERGISQHHDLGASEKRLEPADRPGIIFLDGHPFVANMPKRLRELRRPGLNATSEEKAEQARIYNERWAYAFSTNGPPTRNGAQRYRGPVHGKKVRCPNHPESMRWDPRKPLTNCTPGQPCACAATLTVKADDKRARHRQPELYGTEKWLKRYGARNLIESFNASLKNHHMRLQRHSTRVFGLAKNTILLGFILAATNMAILLSRYEYDPAKPETLPAPGTQLEPLAQRAPTGSNARHPTSPPPANGPPPPIPGEQPWSDIN